MFKNYMGIKSVNNDEQNYESPPRILIPGREWTSMKN